ncbi:hypothetical protein DOY81_004040, partial [Sarcophaga bullata]
NLREKKYSNHVLLSHFIQYKLRLYPTLIHTHSGTLHRMLKYWRNSPKKTALKKSSSFIEYRKKQTNVIYQRLESYDETKLEKLRPPPPLLLTPEAAQQIIAGC